MARVVRNGTPLLSDAKSKKRKRESSLGDDEGRPSPKQPRPNEVHTDAGDLPLSASDAHKILVVLESIDTNGLLDRLFKFPTPSSARQSLRSLLQNSGQHSLRVLRSALNNLLPLTSNARGLFAPGAAQQQQFCDFAKGLFDEIATRGPNALDSQRDTVFLSDDEDDAEVLLPVEDRKRKYAMVQRLPSGDWWSSATIPHGGDVGLTRAAAKALNIRQAELVSIIPSQPIPAEEMPLFATLKPVPVTKQKDDSKKPITLPTRTLPAPKLLDYGVYATFAPYFDSENAEIGNDQIHRVVHESLLRRKARAIRTQMLEKKAKQAEAESALHQPAVDDDVMVQDVDEKAVASLEKEEEEMDIALPVDPMLSVVDGALEAVKEGKIRGPIEPLQDAFTAVKSELSVSELLAQNAVALDSLVRLQRERFMSGSSGKPSEPEFDLADQLNKSLATLLALQPRSATNQDKSVVPSASALRALHYSMLAAPASGWRGTLATSRPTSLQDDNTMYVKATARAQAAAAATAAAHSTPTQPNGVPRTPVAPVPSTPTTQAPLYTNTPFAPPTPNPMYYGYYPPTAYGYAAPNAAAAAAAGAGATRVVPNMLKGTPGPWTGYPPMPPQMMGKAQPATPTPRTNPSFYRT